MQMEPLSFVFVGAGIAAAVLAAVVSGTLAARLFFKASGLGRDD